MHGSLAESRSSVSFPARNWLDSELWAKLGLLIRKNLITSITTPSGLKIEEIHVGTGDTAQAGHFVSVHYTGWLTNGSKFDSSKDRDEPFEFSLGAHMVIAGWDEGVQGMKVGGIRKLTIPPQLGYGARGAGGVIPPNATLVFEVELLDVSNDD